MSARLVCSVGSVARLVEPCPVLTAIVLQLPVPCPHHAVIAALPEDRVIRPADACLARGRRQQVQAINCHAVRKGRARRSGKCRRHVDMGNRCLNLRARRDALRPAHEQGHADAAFEQGDLPAAIGRVDLRQADIARARHCRSTGR